MTFNPKQFVKTASDTFEDSQAFDQFIRENEHLALPFHIEGLENVVPPQYPGELAIYAGRSHHGKSTAMRDAAFKAQMRIENMEDYVIGMVSLEDTSETTAANQIAKYGGDYLQYADDHFVFVGNSFGMSGDDISNLNMGNIIKSLDYGLNQFSKPKRYAAIWVDYAQIIPPDPERRIQTSNDQKRLQIADDCRRIFHAAKYFKCPIGFGCQALIKTQRDNYKSKMKIPGAADLAEAQELYSIPDIVYSYWFPKIDIPIGEKVEEGNWCFRVEQDLVFVRIAKRRNAERLGYKGSRAIINRVFPCRIRDDGSYYYDADFHKHAFLKPMQTLTEN